MNDKAIRSAKLTAAGILDKARARTAVTRAGGQIAPSKYLPDVPRQVHADGGKVAESYPFMQHLQQASEDMGHGFAFEEGGCLGMAHALADEIGGRIAASKSGFKHYYAEKNGNLYDYTGKTQDKAGHRIVSLPDAVREISSSQNEHDADKASAREVIEEAKSRVQGRATGGRVLPKGYSLKVDPDRLGVLARFKGRNVGQLTLSRDRETGKLSAFQMAVHPDHQRKGLMSAMHDAAEDAFGPMEPDKTLTDDGFAFWKGYRPDAVSNNLRFHTDKLMGQTVKTPYGPGTVRSVGSTGMNAELENGNTGWARAADNEDVLRNVGIDPSTLKYAKGGAVDFLRGNHPLVPDVLYHGTARDVRSFDPQAKRSYDVDPSNPEDTDTGWFGKGHYFTAKPSVAYHYAKAGAKRQGDQGANIIAAHISLKNPFVVDMKAYDSGATNLDQALTRAGVPMHPRGWRKPSEQTAALMAMGHDGVIATREGQPKEYVAFKPEQIKSAISATTFDPNDPDMTRADGGRVGKAYGGGFGYVPQAALPQLRLAVAQPLPQAQPKGGSWLNTLTDLAVAAKKPEETAAPVHGFGATMPPSSTPAPTSGAAPQTGNMSGFYAPFKSDLDRLIAEAPGAVTVTSGYRTPERQQELWDQNAAKYPDPEVRDNYVARPGHSSHNYGLAADLSFASPEVQQWVHDNAAKYNLQFRMDHEGWHVEPINVWELRDQLGPPAGYADGGKVTDNDNFQNWFGNSVTHTDGQPHVFYTGTSKDKDFTSFNVGRHGAWFTRDPDVASQYAEENDSQGYKQDGWNMVRTNTASRVIPAYVKAENPYTGELPPEVMSGNYKASQSAWFDTLRAKGHDAWMPASQGGNLVVALKEPQQIKSIYNNGQFGPNQKHMNKAGGGNVTDITLPLAARAASADAPSQGFKTLTGNMQDRFKASADAYQAAKDDGAFDNVQMGDVYKYNLSPNSPPMRVVSHTMRHVNTWGGEAPPEKVYRDHYPVAELERQDTKNVAVYPVELIEKSGKYTLMGRTPRAVKAGGGEVDDPMFGHHNTSAKGVEVASGLGGIPMPSMAISKVAHPLENFGDVTLMAHPSMVTPSRDTNVWSADTYTGRQPRGDEEFSDPKAINRAMQADPNFGHMRDITYWHDATNSVTNADEMMKTAQLGVARGIDPKQHASFHDYVSDVRQKLGYEAYKNDHMPGLRAYGDIKRVLYPKDLFTASGNRKKPVDYTLENVMKRMKGAAEAGAEGFNYGPGNFRAIHTPKFASMGEIKSDRGLIVPSDQMKPIKSQFEDAYSGLVEKLVQATGRKGFRAYDEAADALTDISKGRRHDWFGDVPPELVSQIRELGRHASKMPTEYFEAKSKRAIPLSAFPAALVPKSDPESARRLTEAGVKKVMTYGSPEERVAMYRSQPDLMFKNGGKAMALTRRFTKDGAAAMMALKSKGN